VDISKLSDEIRQDIYVPSQEEAERPVEIDFAKVEVERED